MIASPSDDCNYTNIQGSQSINGALLHAGTPSEMIHSRRSKHTNATGRNSTVRSQVKKPMLSADEVYELVLKANEPPKGADLLETFQLRKARDYMVNQFGKIQQQTGMHPTTLLFSKEYERLYVAYTIESSLNRIRSFYFIAFIAVALVFWYDTTLEPYKSSPNKTTLLILSFGIALPVLLFGGVCTLFRKMQPYHEILLAFNFLTIAMVLIFRKPIARTTGPVLPLVIWLIPLFGITRMRFVISVAVGWTIFFSYLIVQLVAPTIITAQLDKSSDIIYQTINYGIAIIGGMVSNYRQELIRRRNYALKLPFSGMLEDVTSDELQNNVFSRSKLLNMFTLSFKHADIESIFYRYWYLIDPFPYENPNRGELHKGVFRVIRFAVLGLFLNQIVLGIQDYKLLKKFSYANNMAYVIRYGIVVPIYLASFWFMYHLGHHYYITFLKEAETEQEQFSAIDIPTDTQDATQAAPLTTVAASSPPKSAKKRFVTWQQDKLINKKSAYVRSAQVFAGCVIFIHIVSMAVLLIQVGTNMTAKPNVYFMGFLNALLFAHRSGFKVRFVYASRITTLIGVAFVITASQYLNKGNFPNLWIEYSCYMTVTLLLGMMISNEEEGLRRTFFVLKSMRELEFEEWFQTVLKLQSWVRLKLQRKLRQVRDKCPVDAGNVIKHQHTEVALVNTQAYLAQASKLGCWAQVINIVVVLIDIITAQ